MDSFKKVAQELLDEITGMLSTTDNGVYTSLVNGLLATKHIVVVGDGRSNYVAAAFARKLSVLGRSVTMYGEAVSRPPAKGDLLIVVSFRGARGPLTMLVDSARRCGARVCAIVGETSSVLASQADAVVAVSAQSRTPFDSIAGSSRTSALAFDEAVMIYLDAVLISMQEVLRLPMAEGDGDL